MRPMTGLVLHSISNEQMPGKVFLAFHTTHKHYANTTLTEQAWLLAKRGGDVAALLPRYLPRHRHAFRTQSPVQSKATISRIR